MSHGWGGTAANLRADAVVFARAGYLVVTFDYRGWGASDSRVILTKPQPAAKSSHRFTAEVHEVREVVDPIDMTTDLANAVSWVVRRAAVRPRADRPVGQQLLGRTRRVCRRPRPARQGHGQPGAGLRLAARHARRTRNGSRPITRARAAHARRDWVIRRRARG